MSNHSGYNGARDHSGSSGTDGGGSHNSSSTNSTTAPSTSEMDYCVRMINYLISTLKLPIPEIRYLDTLNMEVLLRIHCTLLGISWDEFIPSANPREDAERMILSLKDRFGTDNFGALEADKIAAKNTTQLRFLLENFHLILNHQLSRKKSIKRRPSTLTSSESGNHLSVWTPSTTNLKQDSFYVFPHLLDDGSEKSGMTASTGTKNGDESNDDSFQTVDNVVVNVFDQFTSDDSTIDPLFTNGVDPHSDPSRHVKKSQTNRRAPLTSSPIVSDGKKSKVHQSPNMSSIRPSQSALQQTMDTSNFNNRKPPSRSQSLQRHSNHESKNVKAPTRKDLHSRDKSDTLETSLATDASSGSFVEGISRETQFMSDSSSSDTDDVFKKVSDIHSNMRNQLSDSLIALDKDISKLKKKSTQSAESKTAVRPRKPLPSLRWLMPVDVRFPTYKRGIIVPKCTSYISNTKTKASSRPCSAKKSTERDDFSTLAQRGSRFDQQHYELCMDE